MRNNFRDLLSPGLHLNSTDPDGPGSSQEEYLLIGQGAQLQAALNLRYANPGQAPTSAIFSVSGPDVPEKETNDLITFAADQRCESIHTNAPLSTAAWHHLRERGYQFNPASLLGFGIAELRLSPGEPIPDQATTDALRAITAGLILAPDPELALINTQLQELPEGLLLHTHPTAQRAADLIAARADTRHLLSLLCSSHTPDRFTPTGQVKARVMQRWPGRWTVTEHTALELQAETAYRHLSRANPDLIKEVLRPLEPALSGHDHPAARSLLNLLQA